MKNRIVLLALLFAVTIGQAADRGFIPLFNGRDLTGWKVPASDNGHRKVLNGVIDYDARREASGSDKNLWPYLRGTSKAQVNIWCWPIGSGEVYGFRMDQKMPPEVRAGVTPRVRADKPVGEWNTFEITMKSDRVTIVLNGRTVIDRAQLPGIPAQGALALQHHGTFKDGTYDGASALVQFRNISIRELDPSGK